MQEPIRGKRFYRKGLHPARVPRVYSRLYKRFGEQYLRSMESKLAHLAKQYPFVRERIGIPRERMSLVDTLQLTQRAYEGLYSRVRAVEQKNVSTLSPIAGEIIKDIYGESGIALPTIGGMEPTPISKIFSPKKRKRLSPEHEAIVDREVKRLMFQTALIQGQSIRAMNLIRKYKGALDRIDPRLYPTYEALVQVMSMGQAGVLLLDPAQRRQFMGSGIAGGLQEGQSFFELLAQGENKYELRPHKREVSFLQAFNFPILIYELSEATALAKLSEAEAHTAVLPKKLAEEVVRRIDNKERELLNYVFGPLSLTRLDAAMTLLARTGIATTNPMTSLREIRELENASGIRRERRDVMRAKQELFARFTNLDPDIQERFLAQFTRDLADPTRSKRDHFLGTTRALARALRDAKRATL